MTFYLNGTIKFVSNFNLENFEKKPQWKIDDFYLKYKFLIQS